MGPYGLYVELGPPETGAAASADGKLDSGDEEGGAKKEKEKKKGRSSAKPKKVPVVRYEGDEGFKIVSKNRGV
jgi:hypothetical protein